MSLVIDTSGFDCESEVQVYEPESESQIADDSQTESTPEPEPEPELEDSEPPSFPPAATSLDESDDDDADDFKSKIWNAEMRCRGKEAIVEDLKEQLKFAKADYEDSVAALRKLATWGRDPVAKQAKPEAAEPDEPVEQPEVIETAPDESWKSHSLIEMLKSAGIAGMGEKKLDSLADVCQTFGDFEDLRTKASLEGVHLKEVLPTGFGEKITDQIEEAYFSAIKTISSQEPEREYKPEEIELKSEEFPQIIESVCESAPTITTSKTIDLDDL